MAHVQEIIHSDRRVTIREAAEDVSIAFGTCQKILTEDLQMRHVTAKFVPCLLTAEQKDVHVSNKANVLPVEHIIISSTEGSAAGEVQYQDHVDCVLRY